MRRRRSPAARILAPLALLAAIGAVWAVLHGEVDKAAQSPTTATAPTAATVAAKKKAKRVPKTYRVRPGDVLSGIAARTGVPLEQIQALNPDVDPNALQTGQVITLSR